MKDPTINHLFDGACSRFGQRPAVGRAAGPRLTYGEFHQQVLSLAAWLMGPGKISPGDRVAILSENSPEWCLCYLAVVRIGAVAVPILPDFTGPDARHIITEAGARLVFVSRRQEDKIAELDTPPPVVVIGPEGGQGGWGMPLSTILTAAPSGAAAAFPEVGSGDLASIIYTSGTSGHSKGVMLSHGNFCSNVHAAGKVIDVGPDWIFLSLLPISHAYEFTTGFLLPLTCGALILYTGKSPTPTILQRLCARERPMAMCMVPMVMEKIYKKRVKEALAARPLLGTLSRMPLIGGVIHRRIGRRLLEFFGGRLRVLAIGGAALGRETEVFMRRARLPFLVGYGLTETSPLVAAGPFGDPRVATGSCGRPVTGVEVRFRGKYADGCGEILVRGPNVMVGYFGRDDLTAESIDADGWFATGDLGFLDEAGNLHVRGRCKSVIVLSHGENIYPEIIEERLVGFPLVAEALVRANGDRLQALIYPDYDYLDALTLGRSVRGRRRFLDASLAALKQEVNGVLPPHSRLHEVTEHPEPFVKTATHKIKRYLYSG